MLVESSGLFGEDVANVRICDRVEGHCPMDIQVIQTQEHSLAVLLNEALLRSALARFAVAFLSRRGLGVIEPGLGACLDGGGDIEFVFGLDFLNTEPGAIDWLCKMSRQTDQQVRCLCYSHPQETGSPVYHPKLYLLADTHRSENTVIVGSSNLTGSGLQDNVEVNVVIVGISSDLPIVQAWRIYREIRNTPSVFVPDADFIVLYQELFQRVRRRWQARMREPVLLPEERAVVEQAQARLPCAVHTQKELIILALRALGTESGDGWVSLRAIQWWVEQQAHAEAANFKWDTLDNSVRGRINEHTVGKGGEDLFVRRGGISGRYGQYRLSDQGGTYQVRPLVTSFKGGAEDESK